MSDEEFRPIWVDSPARVADVCARVRDRGVVAVDTEADSLHSYFHKLCLIQVSFGGEHALLDPLALGRTGLAPFVALLGDPSVEKLFHGSDYDLRVLDRDLAARTRSLRDTQVAAQLLGEPQTGLAALVAKELGIELDKRFQRADWGERPLRPELLAYAAADTAHLEALHDRLANRLAALGRLGWWEEECEALEQVRWEPPAPDARAFERLKGARRLTGEARDRLAALFDWRERTAAKQDVPPFRVVQVESMLALAERPPRDVEELAATPRISRTTVRRLGEEVLRVLANAPPVPPPAKQQRKPVDKAKERHFRQAREVRDAVAGELAMQPGVVAPRSGLEMVAERRPPDVGSLRSCLGRAWRTELLAPRLLPVVAAWRVGGGGAESL
jgi:ribonuclease D